MKKLIPITYTFILGLALVPSFLNVAQAQDHDPCIKVRIGLDIGSANTKSRSAIVNACTQTILVQIYDEEVAITFKEDLNREGSDGKTYSPEMIANGTDSIATLVDHIRKNTQALLENPEVELKREAAAQTDEEESAKILKNIEKMKAALAPYSYLASVRAEVVAVGTQAMRDAKNNLGQFVSTLRSKGIVNFVKLEQVEEGRVGFIGVMSNPQTKVKPTEFVSWDIGGGSLQIVGYLGNQKWQDYGNENGNHLASNPMRTFIVTEYEHKPAVYESKPEDGQQPKKKATSANPILTKKDTTDEAVKNQLLEKAENYATTYLADLNNSGWLANRLEAPVPSKVFGIGGVHKGILMALQNLDGYKDAKGYKQEDLKKLLDVVLYLSDAELSGPQFKIPAEYVASAVTNILGVYSTMKALKISYVQVAKVDNTLGTMTSFSNIWKPIQGATVNPDFVNP